MKLLQEYEFEYIRSKEKDAVSVGKHIILDDMIAAFQSITSDPVLVTPDLTGKINIGGSKEPALVWTYK